MAVIDKIQPSDKDQFWWDTEVRGFGVKVTPKGRKVFVLQYRDPSSKRTQKATVGLFRAEYNLDDARDRARDLLDVVRKGQNPSTLRKTEQAKPTVETFGNRFIEEYGKEQLKPSTLKQYERMLNSKVVPAIGHLKVDAVAPADIAKLHQSLKKSPYEANRVLAFCSVMFSRAVKWGDRIDRVNPCLGIDRYPEKRRDRFLTDDELLRVQEALTKAQRAPEGSPCWIHPSVVTALRLLLAAGCRISEVLKLEWRFIDWEAGMISWPDTKTGGKKLPISEDVKRLLEAQKKRLIVGNPYVFPGFKDRKGPMSYSVVRKKWEGIVAGGNLAKASLHTIRHRVVTDIANANIPIHTGMALTGHKTVQVYLQYHHTEDERTREAAEAVAKHRKDALRAASRKAKRPA